MNQSELESALAAVNLQPMAGQVKAFVVSQTATGETEVYDRWGGGEESGWLLMRSRYQELNPRLLRHARVYLAQGACVVFIPPKPVAAEPEPDEP